MPLTTAVDFAGWLRERAAIRDARGLTRVVAVRAAGDTVLDLAGNDYLGLARDPRVIAAAAAALGEWGAGATGSRLVTGTTELHLHLERSLARFTGGEAGLVLATGYAANLAAITALSDADTLLVSDSANHASIIDACRLSRGRVVVTPHGSLDAVAAALRSRVEARAIVITESVFSADGDPAPLRELHALAREHGALLIVDEAHGLGVLGAGGSAGVGGGAGVGVAACAGAGGAAGAGGVAAAGLAGEPDIVLTVTLSKSLGSQGGAVIASRDICSHILQSARTAIFDTALAPACVAAAAEALAIISAEPQRVWAMRAAATRLAGLARAAGLAGAAGSAGSARSATGEPAGAVVPIVVGSAERAVAAARTCLEHGVRVGCFRPPSVPEGASRLRLTARPDLTESDFAMVARALAAIT